MRVDTFIIDPFKSMIHQVYDWTLPLLFTLGILIVGYLFAHFVSKLIVDLLKSIHFDKVTDRLGLSKVLRNGGLRRKPSEVIGCLSYAVLMVIVLILTVKSIGLTVASDLIDKLLAYIPSVISGVFVLIVGMYIARFVSALVYMSAKSTDMPAPATLARLSKWAIMVYVSIMFLKEIGFTVLFEGGHYTIFIAGIVLTFSLAFGLAGRDTASKYLEVF